MDLPEIQFFVQVKRCKHMDKNMDTLPDHYLITTGSLPDYHRITTISLPDYHRINMPDHYLITPPPTTQPFPS